MYYSPSDDKNNSNPQLQSAAKIRHYRFCQSLPKINNTDNTGVYCNGKPIVSAHRNASRQQRRQYNYQRARAMEFRLSQLGDDHKIFKGALKMPGASEQQWRDAKTFFNKIRSRECQKHGWTIGFAAMQHIDISRRRGNDDLHYDFILFTDIDRTARWISKVILGWWNRAAEMAGCENTTHSACTIVEDRREDNIERITNYCCKYPPDGTKFYDDFLKTFPLPKTKLPVTWFSGFWTDNSFTTQSLFDGELRTQTFSGWQASYKKWLHQQVPGIPEFTTPHFRHEQAEMALQEMALMPDENEVGACVAPITCILKLFPRTFPADDQFDTQITDISNQFSPGQNLQPDAIHYSDHSIQCIIPDVCWIVGIRDNPESHRVTWICDAEGDYVLFDKSEYFNLLRANDWGQVSYCPPR